MYKEEIVAPVKEDNIEQGKQNRNEINYSDDEFDNKAAIESNKQQHKTKAETGFYGNTEFDMRFSVALGGKQSLFKFITMSLQMSNSNGQKPNIYFKPYYVIGGLQILTENVFTSRMFGKFLPVLKEVKWAKMRNTPYGNDEFKTSKSKTGATYTTDIMYIVFECDDNEVDEFVNTMKRVFRSNVFQTSVVSFIDNKQNLTRGPLIEHILDVESTMWKCVKASCAKEYDTIVEQYDALDAVLMNLDIYRILKVMFPGKIVEAHDYVMECGWRDHTKNKNKKQDSTKHG